MALKKRGLIPPDSSPKILLYDIEMSYAIAYGYFGSKPSYVQPRQMKHRQFMICAAWQWYGSDEVFDVSLLDDPARFKKDHRDDYFVVKTLGELVDSADAVIAYNGKRFDQKELRTGLVKHNLPPFHDVCEIDPFAIIKKKFRMDAKGGSSLRNVCDFLHVKAVKGDVSEEDRQAATEGCRKAIKKYIAYNRTDIPTMAEVYEKVKAFDVSVLNRNLFVRDEEGGEIGVCSHCASPKLKKEKKRYTRSGVSHQYRCGECYGYTTFSKAIRRAYFK